MAASVKYSTKSVDERNAIIKEICRYIKQIIFDCPTDVRCINIALNKVGHGAHPFGSAALKTDYIDFSIEVDKRALSFEGLGVMDVQRIGSKLSSELDINEYGDLYYEKSNVYLNYGNFTPDFTFPSKVFVLGACCEGWKRLGSVISKYANMFLRPIDIYNVSLSGKRNTYGESRERNFMCFDNSICNEIADWIEQNIKSKNILKIDLNKVDDIDTEFSSRYETECYGERNTVLEFEIYTQSKKLKECKRFVF